MHKYRTHNCNELRKLFVNQTIKLSGWVHRRRDHGNLLFIDLRDHYGITQLVFTDQDLVLKDRASHLRYESVITVEGKVVARDKDNINNAVIADILIRDMDHRYRFSVLYFFQPK